MIRNDKFVIESLSFNSENNDSNSDTKKLGNIGVVNIRDDIIINEYIDSFLSAEVLKQIFVSSNSELPKNLDEKYNSFKYKFNSLVKSFDKDNSNYIKVTIIVSTRKYLKNINLGIHLILEPLCDSYNVFEYSDLINDMKMSDDLKIILINETIEYKFYILNQKQKE